MTVRKEAGPGVGAFLLAGIRLDEEPGSSTVFGHLVKTHRSGEHDRATGPQAAPNERSDVVTIDTGAPPLTATFSSPGPSPAVEKKPTQSPAGEKDAFHASMSTLTASF